MRTHRGTSRSATWDRNRARSDRRSVERSPRVNALGVLVLLATLALVVGSFFPADADNVANGTAIVGPAPASSNPLVAYARRGEQLTAQEAVADGLHATR